MYEVSLYCYDTKKSQSYRFEHLKEAVKFVKNMKKIYKNTYICISFYTNDF